MPNAVISEVIGSKARYSVSLPNGRTSVLTLQTIPEPEEYPYPGYKNPLGYVGDLLKRAEERDRARHDEYCRSFAEYRAKEQAKQDALIAQYAAVAVRPRKPAAPAKPRYSKTPWTPKPFGLGDWVLVGEERMEGQIWIVSKNELQIVVAFPDGRNRAVTAYASGGGFAYKGVPLVRMTEQVAPTELEFGE